MKSDLAGYFSTHEDWLIERVLHYAKQQGYTEYTSTLKESWRQSIVGITESVSSGLNQCARHLELTPHEDYLQDPCAAFGIEEAKRHRERGIDLSMFLGLFKYYKQAYLDLLLESPIEELQRSRYEQVVERVFDRIEIGFCNEWATSGRDDLITELRRTNRQLTHEKGMYRSAFESLGNPVLLVDPRGIVVNMNQQAQRLLGDDNVPGQSYYAQGEIGEPSQGAQSYPKNGAAADQQSTGNSRYDELFPWLTGLEESIEDPNAHGRVVEVTYTNSIRSRHFEVRMSPMLDVSTSHCGTIISLHDVTQSRQYAAHLYAQASTDSLTGVLNRRYFFELARAEFERAERYKRPISLLMLDIDHFKTVNDTFGHSAGDSVLRTFSSTVQKMLRTCDVVARLGGEEFAVMLPETGLGPAKLTAERLRKAIASLTVIADGDHIDITVSIGVAAYDTTDRQFEDMLARSDKALYRAKDEGRNCIEISVTKGREVSSLAVERVVVGVSLHIPAVLPANLVKSVGDLA